MEHKRLLAQIALGEDSTRQFKSDVRNAEALASEMAAFANSEGGVIYIGVEDDGEASGLSGDDVRRINLLISNSASQMVRSPLAVQSKNIKLPNDRIIIVLAVPKGIDKPYFDKNGVIWLKTGADKRRVNSKEELRRLFQVSAQFHADELPTKADATKLDKLRFRDFLRDTYNQEYPDSPKELIRLLQNMNLAADSGNLNLAGVLLFAERPEWIVPQFVIKAISYPGNEIHSTEYLDTEDFAGTLPEMFKGSLAFILRNLHKVQAGRGVNAPGQLEIPEGVFEELLVNALVHRDYLVSAPIRLFIFDNRIEIISPGHLPNNLTVEKIRAGNSNIRNPILVSYAAKGLLPYHGLGSGIKRALSSWPDIDFTDDQDGGLFVATIRRHDVETNVVSHEPINKPASDLISKNEPIYDPINDLTEQILRLMEVNPGISYDMLSDLTQKGRSTVMRVIKRLKEQGLIKRVGAKKSGLWKVLR
jgi:ATP-dependent DNA helicase RecG